MIHGTILELRCSQASGNDAIVCSGPALLHCIGEKVILWATASNVKRLHMTLTGWLMHAGTCIAAKWELMFARLFPD